MRYIVKNNLSKICNNDNSQRCKAKHRLSFYAQNLKTALQDNRGVALITVMIIILVISILATGMFYFTHNEFNYAQKERDNTQAVYLARAGIEAAAKSFPDVASAFDLAKEINTTLYLQEDTATEKVTISEIASLSGCTNRGKVDVTITQEKRDNKVTVNGVQEQCNAWVFDAVAEVDGAVAEVDGAVGFAKASISPAVFGNVKPSGITDSREYLGWVPKNGIMATTNFTPSDNKSIADVNVPIWQDSYAGVVTIEDVATIRDGTISEQVELFTADYISISSSDKTVYTMIAPAIIVDVPINLKRNSDIAALSFIANTIVFNSEITIFANDIGWNNDKPILGDIFIAPETDSKGYVYFNAPVYVQYGNKKVELFEAGSVYSFDSEVQFFGYALKGPEPKIKSDRWGGWINTHGNTLKNTGELTAISKDKLPMDEINANTLTKIIWE